MSRFYMRDNTSKTSNNIQDNELKIRRRKLLKLKQSGCAFPNDFRRNIISDELHERYGNLSDKELRLLNINVKVCGRMMNRRIMGKISFVTIQDMGGNIQLYLFNSSLPKDLYDNHFKKWDIGDILGASGSLFKTRTGELSVHCKDIRLLTKSLRSLPDKFHKLVDQEIRYRKRYLDLIMNYKVRNIFKVRARVILEIRKFMLEHDFIEVETPILQPIAGGAVARPFITQHNTLNINMYLRISPELYLKRLVVGGFEKIFEISRNFRNEGISTVHNPEFTMMEIYVAYMDCCDVMILLENLLRRLVNRVLGSSIIKYGNYVFDFSKPFFRMTMHEAIFYYCPDIKLQDIDNIKSAISVAINTGIRLDRKWGLGRIQTAIFEKVVEHHLIQPTFITNYPTEVSPLARAKDDDSFFSDRFELFIAGHEIGNGFSELNDSEEQEVRFLNQSEHEVRNRRNFDIDINYDREYLIALEHGLPPTAGVGVGLDRLIMLFTDQKNIRDVILFPTLRPRKE